MLIHDIVIPCYTYINPKAAFHVVSSVNIPHIETTDLNIPHIFSFKDIYMTMFDYPQAPT